MVTLLLVTVVFYAIPIGTGFTSPPIKIGIIGPMYWIQGTGMVEGAQLAVNRINALGGIAGHEVILYTANTHTGAGDSPTSSSGAAAMTELMGYDVDFVQGCFRSEAAFGAREVAMDNRIIYTIAGAGTNELIDDPTYTSLDTVRGNYARYKYLFRTTPPNSTMLFYSIAGFLKYAMIAKLMPLYTGYATPLKVAVVSESAVWADVIHGYLTNELFWNYMMGLGAYGGVDIVPDEGYRVHPVDSAWVTPTLADIVLNDPRLVIEVISGPVGRALAIEWSTVKPNAALVGIDVPGQEIALHWTATGGACETETFLVTSGGGDGPDEGTPINTEGPTTTTDFYYDYYNTYGHAPIYTSYAAYDTIMGTKESVEAWVAQYGDFGPGPIHDDPDYDKLIPIIEQTNRHGVVGWFRYTSGNPGHNGDFTDYDPNTAGDQPYPYLAENPTLMGTLHEVYNPMIEIGPTWPLGYTRAMQGSWQAGRLEIVFPMDQSYSKIWALPSWMYPYPTDVNQDGTVNIVDVAIVSFATGSTPGSLRWQYVADVNSTDTSHWLIDGDDLTPVEWDYGKVIVPPPLG